MELFRNRDLKKMYENFVSNTIFTMFDCKYCNLQSCIIHYRFDCSCNNCRIVRCKKCQNFNIELDILMLAANTEARLYILNVVRDFFTVSDTTLKFFFNFSSKNELNIDHLNNITWDLKKFHGTKKGKVVESLSKTMCYIANINRKNKRILKYKL